MTPSSDCSHGACYTNQQVLHLGDAARRRPTELDTRFDLVQGLLCAVSRHVWIRYGRTTPDQRISHTKHGA